MLKILLILGGHEMSETMRETTVRTESGKITLPGLKEIPTLAGEASALANRQQLLQVCAQVSLNSDMVSALVKATNACVVRETGKDKAFLTQKGISTSVPKEVMEDLEWIYYAHLAEVNGIRVHRANKVKYPLWMWRIITPVMKHTVGGTTITPSFTKEAWAKYITETESGKLIFKERQHEEQLIQWYTMAGIELVEALPRAYEVKDGTFGIFELEVDKRQGFITKYNNTLYPDILDTYGILYTKIHGFKKVSMVTNTNEDMGDFVFQTDVVESVGVKPDDYEQMEDASVRLDIKFFPYTLQDAGRMIYDEAKMCIQGGLKSAGVATDGSKDKVKQSQGRPNGKGKDNDSKGVSSPGANGSSSGEVNS